MSGTARRTIRALRDAAQTVPFWLLAGTFTICGATTNGSCGPTSHRGAWLTDRFDSRRLLAIYYALRGLVLMVLPLMLTSTVQPSIIFVVAFGVLDLAIAPRGKRHPDEQAEVCCRFGRWHEPVPALLADTALDVVPGTRRALDHASSAGPGAIVG
ncbi:MAG: hypothetical protein ACRDT0_09905 [Pseudonocardiaceae bacterium]